MNRVNQTIPATFLNVAVLSALQNINMINKERRGSMNATLTRPSNKNQ
jgi:hypothetical protein